MANDNGLDLLHVCGNDSIDASGVESKISQKVSILKLLPLCCVCVIEYFPDNSFNFVCLAIGADVLMVGEKCIFV